MPRTRPAWAEHAGEVLARAGHRRAAARQAVIEVLGAQSCAISAQDIEDRLRRGDRSAGRASVYRALELLVEHGLVARLEVGQGTALYERVEPSGHHHHHLVCDHCGRLVPFDDAQLERSIAALARRVRFRVDSHDVVLHGSCDRC